MADRHAHGVVACCTERTGTEGVVGRTASCMKVSDTDKAGMGYRT